MCAEGAVESPWRYRGRAGAWHAVSANKGRRGGEGAGWRRGRGAGARCLPNTPAHRAVALALLLLLPPPHA